MTKANFLSRLLAFIVDQLVMVVFVLVLALILGGLLAISGNTESDMLILVITLAMCFITVLAFLMQFVYFGYFWRKTGQTPGMKLLGIKLIRRGSGDISFWRGALRGTLGYYISSLVFYIGFLWALFDWEKETWHDKLFDTHVVNQ